MHPMRIAEFFSRRKKIEFKKNKLLLSIDEKVL